MTEPSTLARLHSAAFHDPRPWTEEEFADLLARPGIVLAARRGGFALGRVTAGECELLTIAVHPRRQGQGVGRRLLDLVLDAAATAGADEVFLEVSEDNSAARSLYAAAGFTVAGRRRGYYRGADALVLRRALGSGRSDAA